MPHQVAIGKCSQQEIVRTAHPARDTAQQRGGQRGRRAHQIDHILRLERRLHGVRRAALEQQLRELHLQEQVALSGSKNDMPAFYASLDLLVSASRQEGLPVALLEGMASGLPVVATRVGAVPQVVADGITGLLVEPDSPEALAEAMERALASPALRAQFGKAGRSCVAVNFSAERMTADYLAVYEGALHAHVGLQPGAGRPQERRA